MSHECEDRPLPPRREAGGPYRIDVVCLGNICRSPIAAIVLRARLAEAGRVDSFQVTSSGTGSWHIDEPMDRRSRAALARAGYDGSGHRARLFPADGFDRVDLVLAMDENNVETLEKMASPEALAEGRLRMFGCYGRVGPIPDPYYGGPDGFDHVVELVERAADDLTDELLRIA